MALKVEPGGNVIAHRGVSFAPALVRDGLVDAQATGPLPARLWVPRSTKDSMCLRPARCDETGCQGDRVLPADRPAGPRFSGQSGGSGSAW